ncbi:MAG: AAA family ATPase [Symploca sp. SIO3E6]|nr:AAA family ATPase [Caldora sp. SIO3E6]
MSNFSTNYQIISKIYESANSLVYRATLKDEQPIILKILKENYPTPSELTRYKQEYEITRSLNVDNIIKAYDLQRYENSLVMLLEDFGGQSLKLLLPQNQLSLEDFLNIAIKITESLAVIHRANIIHKDINPSNIIYNSQTKQLKLIDFGISTRLSQEFIKILPPHKLEGTLTYIAPEQTGRMNRGVDYRSDFYSLGVTFYELLTNKLPFESTDPMELVHYHIAQQPLPPNELIPDIPLAVSNIVIKLLAKTPEERYQSAWGIKADLETCLNQLKTQREISLFPLARQDIADKFYIPQKLYGREQEVTQLITTFEQVANPPEPPLLSKEGYRSVGIILISGYSGIGKSALVNEIHKPITRQRGQFISGKFDQLQRDIPYLAISQAFQDLIRQLLSEPDITLQTWRQRILEALGNKGQIIIEVIPELENIIGQQPAVEQLGATESQNRFNLFFQRFLNVFCQKGNPLVLFIDDLQWADLPSLNLIEQLISDTDNKYFLVIGAYRDNEVSIGHPLIHTLNKIKQAKVPINEITIYPLEFKYINQLISDTLNCDIEVSKPLAEVVAQKTGGNPFFLTQFLYSLYQESLLVFNSHQPLLDSDKTRQGYWQWNIEEIKSLSFTDNVVDLMVNKIEKLAQTTQQVLKLAACIGNRFNLEFLSIVNNKSTIFTAQELQPALYEGLIIPLDNNYKVPLFGDSSNLLKNTSETDAKPTYEYIFYRFLHDRVQQAAYCLIPEEEKQQVHLQIGRLLLKNLGKYELQNKIFDVVNQLNQGSSLITEQSEKDELAQLNLQVGKKAKDSTAYEPALIYLETALKLLSSDSWTNQYNLTLEIYTVSVEIQALNTQFEKADELSAIVIQNAKEVLDTVKVYEVKIQSYYSQLQLEKAIDTALEILAKLGVIIPSSISQRQEQAVIKKTEIESFLQDKSIGQLADLPTMTNPYKLAAIRLLLGVTSSAIISNPQLYPLVTLTSVNLCTKYGNSPLAASVYVFYGQLLCGFMQDIETGYQYGQLSLNLLEKYNVQKVRPMVVHYCYAFTRHWKEPFITINLNDFEEAIQVGLELGDFEHVGYNAISYCLFSIFSGSNLEEFESKCQDYSNLILKFQQDYTYYYYEACKKMLLNLLNDKQDNYYLLFSNCEEEEDNLIQIWTKNNTQWLLFISCLSKTFCSYFFKNYERGLKTVILAEKYAESSSAYLIYIQNIFYSSLTLLAVYHQVDIKQKINFLEKVEGYQTKISFFQESCPENYGNKYNLVEAEKARILGNNWQAQEFYEKAIQGAKKYEFIHEEALAYERASEFYLALDRKEIGQLYLRNAHHCYTRWGAKAKVQQLEEEYPQYFVGVTNQSKSTNLSTTTSTAGNDGTILDLNTVLKASQAISGEIKQENLLQNLMKIVIENAGAQIGFLILSRQGNWVIEAQGTVDSKQVTVLQSMPIESVNPDNSIPILPTTIINYVARTQENIVLNDAAQEGQFINDPYIIATQSKSILCTPLLNQGQLRGIVYLENDLTTDAFTSERVELLNILSTQAAISIENARLYEQLEDYSHTLEIKVDERTQELQERNTTLAATLKKLKATQAQIIAQEKLASLGALTAGVAHEIKNPLNFVNNFAELSVELTTELIEEIENQKDRLDSETIEYIEEILQDLGQNVEKINHHGKRADNIVKGMLMHSRATTGERALTNINSLLAEYVNLAYHGMRAKDSGFNITIESDYDDSLEKLHVIPQDLSRVFLNVANNACYAAYEKKKAVGKEFIPKMKVSTKNLGNQVELRIRDNGNGIPPEVLDKIFHPFFTTKPPGKGTGLGLSISHDIIVQGHQGQFQVETEEGSYAEFIITLPKEV